MSKPIMLVSRSACYSQLYLSHSMTATGASERTLSSAVVVSLSLIAVSLRPGIRNSYTFDDIFRFSRIRSRTVFNPLNVPFIVESGA